MTLVVGIAGGTASGKSTIAHAAATRLGAALLTHDRYYRDADAHTNFDHPDALETDLLVAHLDRLRQGEPVDVPVYDFAVHRRAPVMDRVEPGRVLIVEGILVLASPELRARFDLAVFVDAAADVRLIRRVRRDIVERGRDLESVLSQYLATVRPMHEKYVQPSLSHASLVLDGEGRVEDQVLRLEEAVGRRL